MNRKTQEQGGEEGGVSEKRAETGKGEEKMRRSAGCKVSPGCDMWIWGCHQACEVEIIKN